MVPGRLRYCCYCILFEILLSICHAIIPKNYTFYRLVALTKRDRQILYIIHKNFAPSNFLNGVTNEAAIPMHIAVEDESVELFENLLNNTNSLYTKYLHYSYYPKLSPTYPDLTDDIMVTYKFNDFATILQIYQYWENKYQGGPSRTRHKNPAVFILGGEEGRDWISPAIVLNYVKHLLEETFGDWTDRFDAYFIPVLNPDGYHHSMYEDRFWAKNRSPIKPRTMCPDHKEAVGINIDRNWLDRLHRGVKACTKLYFGGYLSEAETYNLSEFLDGIAPRTLAFFNVKGFDNLITTPYADKDKIQNNFYTMKEILQHMCRDINARFNKSYYYGITTNLLFNYTGNCADWVKENLNVPVVATFYLKHGSNVLPSASDIAPLFEEFSSGINQMLSLTIDLYEPLFNSQWRHYSHDSILLLIGVCFILCLI